MYIKTVSGIILYEGDHKTLRRCVEAAVRDKADLSGANLRGANLRYAKLDEAKLPAACLWGADLAHADIAGAVMNNTDMRASRLQDTCLAESNFNEADFRGAYFDGTIIRAGTFERTQFSCPSLFSCDWSEAQSFEGAVYWHLGETACALPARPAIVRPAVTMPLCNHELLSGASSLQNAKTI